MRASDPTEMHQLAKFRSISPYLLWLIWVIWLPFFIPPIIALFQSHPTLLHLISNLTGVALFFGIYLWATLRNARRLVGASSPREISAWLTIVVLTVLCFVLIPGNRTDWGDLFIFTSAYIAGSLPTVRALLAVAALTLLTITFGKLGGLSWSQLGPGIIYIVVVGVVVICLVRAIIASRDLRMAREEIARLAVTAERLRIARDLHDLLGHNLSLIALKSELAGRLLKVAPERAAIEIGDVEQAARATLQEVREAVASYRQPTFASELHAAQEILAAAGIAYHREGDENMTNALPSAIEAALSWAVREGITNVIKHSRASQCTIQITRNKRAVSVEISDDGITTSAATTGGGNGLRGLGERAAALGGEFEAGPRAGGGFRLAISIPLAQRNNDVVKPMPPAINPAVSAVVERNEQL